MLRSWIWSGACAAVLGTAPVILWAQNGSLGGPIQPPAAPVSAPASAPVAPLPSASPATSSAPTVVPTLLLATPPSPQLAAFENSPALVRPLSVPGRPVRVGVSTAGSPLAVHLPQGGVLTDWEQGGRALRLRGPATLRFSFAPGSSALWNGRTYTGIISVETPLGTSGGWRHVLINVAGGQHARVTSNGRDARYGRPYRGHLEVFGQKAAEPNHRKGPLAVVNVVALEDYLKGVVPWEMSPGAPFEALKAQAIAARTKALQQIAARPFAGSGFDVCDYDACQGYPGTENEKPSTTRAVEVTKGLALYHRNQIIDAVFCTNAGGITANARDVWRGQNPVPYLQSRRDVRPDTPAAQLLGGPMSEAQWAQFIASPLDTWARPSEAERAALAERRARFPRTAALYGPNDWPEFYRWEREVSAADADAAFVARGLARVTGFQVESRADSGRIRRLLVSGEDASGAPQTLALEGDGTIRSMFSGRLGSTTALPSSLLIVAPQSDAAGQLQSWKIHGAGWGHGVGMCQRGAQNRARAGQTARQIIGFYYNQVEIRNTP